MSNETDDLLQTLLDAFGSGYGLGSMSCSVYDTAWIACIVKPSTAGPSQWLFPNSFQSVLDFQHADGGWHWPPDGAVECASGTLLSSLASLYAVSQHIKQPLQLFGLQDMVRSASSRGVQFIAAYARHMDLASCDNVGFEVLVPALLDLLEKEGVAFSLPNKERLFQKRDSKLSRIPITKLSTTSSTILHSCEAFLGDNEFSFDSLRGQLIGGSMMASPAATAAYLIRSKEWDDSAEAYLRLTLSNGAGRGSASVPSAYPSTNFELIWVVSTLLKARCVDQDLKAQNGQLQNIFEQHIAVDGLVAFSTGIQPDVDDSANASVVLSLLNRPGLTAGIRNHFETAAYFETYKHESNDSVSANCNTLLALLLNTEYDPGAVPAIAKISRYLSQKWLNATEPVKDKWNVSEYYATMLLAQSFAKLIQCWENGDLAASEEDIMSEQIILISFQSLVRVLATQNHDGSWGIRGPREETAYALLALVELASLPMALYIEQQIHSAISRGRGYLEGHRKGFKAEYLWVEKVLYGSEYISQAYMLAALKAPIAAPQAGCRLESRLAIDYHSMAKSIDILHSLPLLVSQPRWLLVASWIEGQLLISRISDLRQGDNNRVGMTKDKYFGWIPVLWALANNVNGCNTPRELLSMMLRVSVLNFQIDEFMENVVEREHGDDITSLHAAIDACFETQAPQKLGVPLGAAYVGRMESVPQDYNNNTVTGEDELQRPNRGSVSSRNLQCFVDNIKNLAGAVGVQLSSFERTQAELKAFLHAHLTQTRLNREFIEPKQASSTSLVRIFHHEPTISFRAWLNGTAAVHTSCPYSFELYLALASAVYGAPLLKSLRQTYIAQDMCGHLARMCRLYNDFGSLKRDVAEANVNCVNFPEFWEASGSTGSSDTVQEPAVGDKKENAMSIYQRPKQILMELADWERTGLERAYERLSTIPETCERSMRTLKVFVDVTDLFGQVYVVKDLASKKM